jgi:hypothetical protein
MSEKPQKGLVAVQFWPGDRPKALRLANFLADLEPVKRQDTDFLFVARFDSGHDPATVKKVSGRFNTHLLTTTSRAAGHPWGSWVLWFSAVEWFYNMRRGRKIPDYKWIFPFEADCCPTSKNWLSEMHAEWDRLNSPNKVYIVGAETYHYHHHANGNLMCSGDMDWLTWLVKGVTVSGVPAKEAWDIYLFPKFARWGVEFSPRMWNCCGRATLDEDTFKYCLREHSFVHGVKDDSLYRMARRQFLGR